MKHTVKGKAQRTLNKILSGDFAETEVDSLFMQLREYSSGHKAFRDVADFIAHAKGRDRGPVYHLFKKFYLNMRKMMEYTNSSEDLDLAKPFPLYLKQLLIYRVEDLNPGDLKQNFNLTPDCLKKHIMSLFKEDTDRNIAILVESNIKPYSKVIIDQLLISYQVRPAFTDDEFMNDLVAVLQKNKLQFNEDDLAAQRAPIVLCVMLLMHQVNFKIDAQRPCELLIDTSSAKDINLGQVGSEALPDEFNLKAFGTLVVSAQISFEWEDGWLKLRCHLFTSKLPVTDYCHKALFVDKELLPEQPGLFKREIVLGKELCLQNSKLAPVDSEPIP